MNIIRPLLKFSKQDLLFISKNVFNFYIEDPSNENKIFQRVKIRNLIKKLQSEGLDAKKFDLTINNLKFANDSIKFYTQMNIINNSNSSNNKKSIMLNKEFFNQPEEVVFRSLTEIIKIIGKKYYPVRGKKIDNVLELIKNKSFLKTTLGNCILKKVNNTIIVSKER